LDCSHDERVAELARKLELHARSEEELLYPAAVLVGDLVRASHAELSSEAAVMAPPD
jgi:hemerythrin superfamily protein